MVKQHPIIKWTEQYFESYTAAPVWSQKSGLIQVLIFKWLFTGECCVALRSLAGASEQFETFLCHRGEEMGSIRGRVRIHVPKDRRGTREKIYGESTAAGSSPASSDPGSGCCFLLNLCLHRLCPLSLSFPCKSHVSSSIRFLTGAWPWLLHLLVSSDASSFGSSCTQAEASLRNWNEDKCMYCVQVRGRHCNAEKVQWH